MQRSYFASTIEKFMMMPETEVLGQLVKANQFALEQTQRDAWLEQIDLIEHAIWLLTRLSYYDSLYI